MNNERKQSLNFSLSNQSKEKNTMLRLLLVTFLLPCITAIGQTTKVYNLNGQPRKAIIYAPSVSSQSQNLPVVFIFHGHGGNADFVSRKIDIQNHYKEALIIFMEGIPGRKSKLDPQGKLNGWQILPNTLENRDIDFFDIVFEDIHTNYAIDNNRIYAVGHSNGARFANVLWKERGNRLAAICSASAQGGLMITGLNPISVWMYMGKEDNTVPFENQEKSIAIVMKNLGVNDKPEVKNADLEFFYGKQDTELVVQKSNGGHKFPKQSIPEIVAFFKRNKKSISE